MWSAAASSCPTYQCMCTPHANVPGKGYCGKCLPPRLLKHKLHKAVMLYLPTRLPVEAGHDVVADKMMKVVPAAIALQTSHGKPVLLPFLPMSSWTLVSWHYSRRSRYLAARQEFCMDLSR